MVYKFRASSFDELSFFLRVWSAVFSQVLLLPYFISYYSSTFTIYQFHNHDGEVFAP